MMDDDDELDAILASVPLPHSDGSSSSNDQGYGRGTNSNDVEMPSTSSSLENLEMSSEPKPRSTATAITTTTSTASKGSVLVNPRQRGNPLLKHIRNVPWEYTSDVVPDYVMSDTTCALFLSVRYYNLHPDYIHERLKELKQSYVLRVLLVLLDVPDPYPILKTLTHIGMLADLTIIPSHTYEDAGRILESYKIYENKPPDYIQESQETGVFQQVIDALTTIRGVSKTDAMTLLSSFGSLTELMKAEPRRIGLCAGIGPQKALRIYSCFQAKFKTTANKVVSDST